MTVFNNYLVVGGWFRKTDGNAGDNIMAWDGQNWFDIGGTYMNGNGTVYQVLPHNNHLTVLGVFDHAYTTPALYIADFDGYSWCGYGTTFDNTILAGCYYGDTLVISGGFKKIDSDSLQYIAKVKGGTLTNCSQFFDLGEIKSSLLSVLPNPTDQVLVLNAENLPNSANSSITIQNSLGKIIHRQKFSPSLDVSTFSPGCYFLRVTFPSGETYQAKFIKQ